MCVIYTVHTLRQGRPVRALAMRTLASPETSTLLLHAKLRKHSKHRLSLRRWRLQQQTNLPCEGQFECTTTSSKQRIERRLQERDWMPQDEPMLAEKNIGSSGSRVGW